MSDAEANGTETEQPAMPVVTMDQFQSFDFEAGIDPDSYEPWTLGSQFDRLARHAGEGERHTESLVLSFLSALCHIALRPEDRAQPWGSFYSNGSGRTAIPADFRGEQNAVLAQVAPTVHHPALRARLADLAWSNDKKQGACAKVAIEAYCELIEKVLTGEVGSSEAPPLRLHGAEKEIHRSLQIMQTTTKKAKRPARLLAAFENLYRKSIEVRAYVIFNKLAGLGLSYELLEQATVAADAEALAQSAPDGDYPEAVRLVWNLAAHLYEQLEQPDARRRCQLGAVQRILAMRNQVQGAGAEAHWIGVALQALHHIDDVDAMEEELTRDYRRLQKKSLREMGTFKIPFDFKEEIEALLAEVAQLDLPAALYRFAFLSNSTPRQKLREQADRSTKGLIADALFGSVHLDGDGKPIAHTPANSLDGERTEAWYIQAVGRSEGIRRHMTVASAIEPMRLNLVQRFDINEGHMGVIAAYSPFVPESHEPIFALGMLRFFQGDYMSAAYLLTPLWEPCIRHIVTVAGRDPAKRFADATEEDMNIGNIFEKMSDELGHILSQPIRDELEWLLLTRPGPTLRHDMAHGHMSAGRCFSADIIYANWLLYRVTCLFIAKHWDEVIRPELLAHSDSDRTS